MAEIPNWAQPSIDASNKRVAPVQRKSDATVAGTEASTATTEAKLPYVAPGAAADVTKTQQDVQFAPLAQSRSELSTFEGLKPVQKYMISLPLLDAALKGGSTPADDSELIMLAAKLQDPEGSVREGDEARYNRVEAALDFIPQQFKKQFMDNEGRFTDEGRKDIRRYLIRRVNSYKQGYQIERTRFINRVERSNERGAVKIDPLDVVGEDPGDAFQPAFDAYEASVAEKPAAAKREEDSAGLFQQTGKQIAGEPIKGFRFSDEAAITAVARDPKATPADLARIITDTAVAEGHATPEQADGMYAANLASATDYFGKFKTPEARAAIPAGVDYSGIDKVAQEQAGILDIGAQALRNMPESAVQLAQGVMSPISDAALSLGAGERRGIYKTVPDLIGEMGTGPTTEATLDMLSERYGGGQELKNTLTTDPLGSLADVSTILTAGGTGAARLPGIAGRIGEAARTAGRYTDPITGAVELGSRVPRYIDLLPQGLRDLPGNALRTPFALTTGVPGRAIREAGVRGFERGRAGAHTDQTRVFEENLRGRGDPQEIIDNAQSAVRAIRDEGAQRYRSGMVDVSNDATILDFAPIDQTLSTLRDRAFRDGVVVNPQAANIYDQVRTIVDEWKGYDPARFHTPEGMDALKQRIGGVVDAASASGDRAAASIATGVYREVRQAVADQVPTYAATMRAYEEAQDVAKEIERTFSLDPKAKVDTQIRTLQTLARNNAYTGYGYRQNLADMMERYGGDLVLPGTSGAALSSPQPRGLQGITGAGTALTGGLLTGTGSAGMLGPAMLIGGIPASIPRVVGEAAYMGGRGVGAATRYGRAALDFGPSQLLDLQRRYPGVVLGGGQLGSRAQEAELFERDAARGEEPPISFDLNEVPREPAPREVVVDAETRPDVDAVLGPDERFDPATDEIVNEVTGERRPSRAYARGGRVEGARYMTLRQMARRYAGGGRVDPRSAVREGDTGWSPGQWLVDRLNKWVPGWTPPRTPGRPAVQWPVRTPVEPGHVAPRGRDIQAAYASAARQAIPSLYEAAVTKTPETLGAVGKYATTHSLGDVVNSVGHGAKSFGRYVMDNPTNAIADFFPVVGDIKGVNDLLMQAAEMRAMGYVDEAEKMERMAAPFAVMGAIPEGGAAAARFLRPGAARAVRGTSHVLPVTMGANAAIGATVANQMNAP